MSKYEAPSRPVEIRREIESKTRAEIEADLATRGESRVHPFDL